MNIAPVIVFSSRGFAPRTPLHALSPFDRAQGDPEALEGSLAAAPARAVRVARSRRSLAAAAVAALGSSHLSRGFAPRTPLHALSPFDRAQGDPEALEGSLAAAPARAV